MMVFACILSKLGYEQIIHHDAILERALNSWQRDFSVSGTRGSILSSDGKILARIAKEQKFRFSDLHEDTMVLAKKVLHSVHNYKLRTVAKYFGIINETAHRALGDAVTTAKVFVNLAAMM